MLLIVGGRSNRSKNIDAQSHFSIPSALKSGTRKTKHRHKPSTARIPKNVSFRAEVPKSQNDRKSKYIEDGLEGVVAGPPKKSKKRRDRKIKSAREDYRSGVPQSIQQKLMSASWRNDIDSDKSREDSGGHSGG